MGAQPRSQEAHGEPARQFASPDDGLYRYVPVPPASYDADGYLFEDGAAQEDWHKRQTSLWYHMLTRHLPAATVCSDLAIHYREGDRGAVIVPDLFVALRVPPLDEDRLSYKLWLDPVPELVIEALSQDTAAADVGAKYATYAHLGVYEYWLFDPQGLELATPLVGHRLRAGRYQPIDADAAGACRSEVLGMDLHVLAGELRFHELATGENLRTYDEAMDRLEAARERTDAAERKLARLRLARVR